VSPPRVQDITRSTDLHDAIDAVEAALARLVGVLGDG
jgi:hypothetical protein